MLDKSTLTQEVASRPLKDLLKKLNKTDDIDTLLLLENHCIAVLQRGHGDWKHGFLGWHDLHSLMIAASKRRDRLVATATERSARNYLHNISPPADAPLTPTERTDARGKTTRQSAKRTRDRARQLSDE